MKRILVFGASNSIESINKKFATYISTLMGESQINLLDLNDYEMPIYSIDREKESGIHELALKFKQQIMDADGVIVSFAEHNGAYSAAFKNIFDWVSRINADVWEGKALFMASTAPGPWGGKSVLQIAFNRFSRRSEKIVRFSLPEYGKNFDAKTGIVNKDLDQELRKKVNEFKSML